MVFCVAGPRADVEGLDDVNDRGARLWFAREYGCFDWRDSLINGTDTEWYRFDFTTTVQERPSLTFESPTNLLFDGGFFNFGPLTIIDSDEPVTWAGLCLLR